MKRSSDQREVGNIVIVQLGQHPLLDQLGDHVVGGDHHVIVGAAGLEHGIKLFIAGDSLVVDFDPGLVLEFVDQALIDIFAPAAHVDNALLVAAAAGAVAAVAAAQ